MNCPIIFLQASRALIQSAAELNRMNEFSYMLFLIVSYFHDLNNTKIILYATLPYYSEYVA